MSSFSARAPRPLLSFLFGCLVIWLVTISNAPFAQAAFEIVTHDVFVDAGNRQTTFRLTFDRPADFFTLNKDRRPAHSFQYFYDADPSVEGEVDFAGEEVVIIRGPEIHVDRRLPIRASLNPSGEEFPDAEGWGEKLGEIDFELAGTVLTFTTPWDLLGESDETFGYHLFAFDFGELTSEATYVNRILVPLPPGLLGGLALAPVAAIATRTLRRG